MSELGKLSQEQNFKGWKEWGYIYISLSVFLKLYWYLYCIIIKGISKKKNLCPCCYYKGNFTQ